MRGRFNIAYMSFNITILLECHACEFCWKGAKFRRTIECQNVMDELKRSITEAPVLISLDLSPDALPIILNVDTSITIG
jgi:hypothetical protein